MLGKTSTAKKSGSRACAANESDWPIDLNINLVPMGNGGHKNQWRWGWRRIKSLRHDHNPATCVSPS